MKALVYHGPGVKAWEDVPEPKIEQATDVIVKMDTTTICGTDLHILQGDVAAVTDGRILGHEAVGTITAVGDAIKGFAVGDRVLVPAITKCGRCEYCQRGMPSHCQTVGGIGWIFGHLIDGTQAELVRVPYADGTLVATPEVPGEDQLASMLALSDVMATGWHCAVSAGVQEGETVVVVGDGAVGLSAVLSAVRLGAGRVVAMSRHESRQAVAREFGATDFICAADGDPVKQVIELTKGGVHHAFEAIGLSKTAEQAFGMLRRGGTANIIGMIPIGQSITLPGFQFLSEKRIQGSMMGSNRFPIDMPRLVDFYMSGKLKLDEMISQRLKLEQVNDALQELKTGNLARSVIVFDA